MINGISSFLDHNFWIRIVFASIPVQIFCVKYVELFLGKLKKTGYLVAFMILKGAALTYFQSLGEHISITGKMTEILFGALSGIIICLVEFYLFEAEPVKILFAMVISEFASTCSLIPAIALVNMVEKRAGSVFGWYLRFQMMDMLIWPIELVLLFLFYVFLRQFREPFRKYEIRHSRLIWLIYLCYFLVMQISQVMGVATEDGIQRGMVLPCMMVTVAAVLGITAILSRQNKTLKTESKFLQLELSMMESQYHAMQYQRAYMEECKKLIDSQMQEILQKGESGTEQIRTAKYLEELKHAYQKIHAGIYCKDWTLDSILYVETEHAQQEGIVVTCKVQNTPKDQESIQCMGKILIEVFEYAITECKKNRDLDKKKLDVQINVIANQAVLLLTCAERKGTAVLKRKIQGLIEERDGSMEIEKREGRMTICVRFTDSGFRR